MPDRRYRVLAVATHPVQYMTPLFRRLATHPSLDFQVAYCTLRGAEASHDPEFGANIQWDVPVLDGHSWTHVPNRGSGAESFFGLFNPSLWKLMRAGNFDAVLCFVGYVRATFWIACLASKFSKAAFIFGGDIGSQSKLCRGAFRIRYSELQRSRISETSGMKLLIYSHFFAPSVGGVETFAMYNMLFAMIIVSLGIAQAIIGHTFLNPAVVADDIRAFSTLYKPLGVGVESGFGTLVIEMGIGGLILWFVMSFAILFSAWRVVKKLRGSPWFPLGFVIFWYAGLLLLPITFTGIQAYEDFVLNAYLWLLLSILFRLPTLAVSSQYAAIAQPSPMYNPQIRMR